MKKQISLILLLFLFSFQLFSQLNTGGLPISFTDKKIKKEIPQFKLAPLDNSKLIIEANSKISENKEQPWQFGKNIFHKINIKKLAVVDTLEDGKLYRFSIKSTNAKSINLRFSKYKLPTKASLYIYNEEKTDIIGAFSSKNNQKNEVFGTGLINGDNIIIEYFEANNSEFKGELIIDRITHGFRSVFDFSKGFGSSGDCNMNVVCDDGNRQNEIKSVCMLVTGGSGFCSGALINNTRSDGTPYILTADHCYKNPADMVFMFNWESETCDNPMTSPSHDDLSGAVLIARNNVSDFCLFKMNDTPPYSYNVYYSGWDANDVSSSTTVGIHHPHGDIKKISYDDNPCVSDYYLGQNGIDNSHWKVTWDRNTTTEGGSSGSPLFNENHKIIGQLHGGYASCNNLDDPDWYGKFSYSWDYENQAEKRLKDWLAPTNSSIKIFEGYDPNIPTSDLDAQIINIKYPKDKYFDIEKILPTFEIRNRGNNTLNSLKISYSVNNGEIISENWTGNLNTGETAEITFEEINLLSGKYSIEAFIENPNGFEDEYKLNDTIRKEFIIYENLFYDDFENAKSWYLTGEFEIDKPLGLGGGTGNHDPNTAVSGEKVLGTDLTGLGQHKGDYENNIEESEFAQSPVIDCSGFNNTVLSFNRWLGTDKSAFDKVSIEIMTDTSDWEKIWDNKNLRVTDMEWNTHIFNISNIADGRKILIKFNVDKTNHAEQFCGWNIDDFKISGIRSKKNLPMEDKIKIFPNPAKRYFYIEISDGIYESINIKISDIIGRKVFERQFSKNEITKIETSAYKKSLVKIDLNNTKSGIFIVTIKTDSKVFSKKIKILRDKYEK